MPLDSTAVLLLIVTGPIGLLLIPLGLPGLWVIVLGILGYGWLTDFRTLSAVFIAVIVGLALLAEVFEAWIGFRFAQRYGGIEASGLGCLGRGVDRGDRGRAGADCGVGGGRFVGAFVRAPVFEYTRARRSEGAVRAGWGAVLGRAAATAVKMAVGIVMVVGALFGLRSDGW